MAVMVAWRDEGRKGCSYLPQPGHQQLCLRDSHLGAHLLLPLIPNPFCTRNQIKRIGSWNLEDCEKGSIFQPLAFLKGWISSTLTFYFPLSPISAGCQISEAQAAGKGPSLSHTRDLFSDRYVFQTQVPDFQFCHYSKQGFCLLLVILTQVSSCDFQSEMLSFINYLFIMLLSMHQSSSLKSHYRTVIKTIFMCLSLHELYLVPFSTVWQE